MPGSQSRAPSRWLITGGCGFIGRSLVQALLHKGGHAIRVLDNLSVGSRDDLRRITKFTDLEARAAKQAEFPVADSVELIAGDILDDCLALDVAREADVIVHLAANTGVGPSVDDPRTDCVTNVIGTFNYLEAARKNGVKRFIFASSGAPIGECVPPIHEELAPHPTSPYGASKLAGEGYCSAYFKTFGVSTVALRFGNVYGPNSGHKNSVVAKFIRNAISGEPIEIYGDGQQTRDFIFITDLLEAVDRAARSERASGQIFQIATNEETTVSALVARLLPILQRAGLPTPLVVNSAPRIGDVPRNFSDTTKARAVLSWRAETPLDEGLETTVRWFLSQRALGD